MNIYGENVKFVPGMFSTFPRERFKSVSWELSGKYQGIIFTFFQYFTVPHLSYWTPLGVRVDYWESLGLPMDSEWTTRSPSELLGVRVESRGTTVHSDSTRTPLGLHSDTKSENKFVMVCIDVNNMFVIVYIKSVTKSVNRFVMVCIEVNNMFVMVYIKSVRLVTK